MPEPSVATYVETFAATFFAVPVLLTLVLLSLVPSLVLVALRERARVQELSVGATFMLNRPRLTQWIVQFLAMFGVVVVLIYTAWAVNRETVRETNRALDRKQVAIEAAKARETAAERRADLSVLYQRRHADKIAQRRLEGQALLNRWREACRSRDPKADSIREEIEKWGAEVEAHLRDNVSLARAAYFSVPRSDESAVEKGVCAASAMVRHARRLDRLGDVVEMVLR